MSPSTGLRMSPMLAPSTGVFAGSVTESGRRVRLGEHVWQVFAVFAMIPARRR